VRRKLSRLLTCKWIRKNEDLPETLVRRDLTEKDGYTTVRVTHSGLITENLRARNSSRPLIVTLLRAYVDRQGRLVCLIRRREIRLS
jgi:hypothetical protein